MTPMNDDALAVTAMAGPIPSAMAAAVPPSMIAPVTVIAAFPDADTARPNLNADTLSKRGNGRQAQSCKRNKNARKFFHMVPHPVSFGESSPCR